MEIRSTYNSTQEGSRLCTTLTKKYYKMVWENYEFDSERSEHSTEAGQPVDFGFYNQPKFTE